MYPNENLCVHSKSRIVEFLVFDKKIRKKKQKQDERESEIDHDAATAHSRGYFLNRKGLPFLFQNPHCRLQSYFETILLERIPLANIKIYPISK